MTRTEADQYRVTGIWPARPMTPFEPLPDRVLAAILEVAWGLIVVLVVLSAVGGMVYVLATGQK